MFTVPTSTSMPANKHPKRPGLLTFLSGLTLAFIAAGALHALTARDRRARYQDTLKAFNRDLFNPVILHLAGESPWSVARLEHRGRRSRALRATPLLAWPIGGGFLMPMPYGAEVDWAHNLRHAGEGVLQYQGVRYRIGHPRIVTVAEARPELPGAIAQLTALSGIRHIMRVDVMPSLTPRVTVPA